MPAVKVCGLCRPEDARAAVEAGAGYVGVVLARSGGRRQSIESARRIFEAAGDAARRVGVFVNGSALRAADSARSLGLDVLQLHGSEPPDTAEFLRMVGPWKVWKAIRPRSRTHFENLLARYADSVDGIVVDGWSAAAAGGTGTRFPWEAVAEARALVPEHLTFVVAGGLTADNVARAVELLAPDVVDVSSGVERVVGEKDAARLEAFAAAARGVSGPNRRIGSR